MAESILHMDLVRIISLYVKNITPSFSMSLLDADLPEFGRTPQVIYGFYPDLRYRDDNVIIIGEAKTQNDIDNDHTELQLNAYIEEVRTFNLQRHIVYCIPFLSFIHVKNFLKRLKIKLQLTDITFHVLDNYNRVAII